MAPNDHTYLDTACHCRRVLRLFLDDHESKLRQCLGVVCLLAIGNHQLCHTVLYAWQGTLSRDDPGLWREEREEKARELARRDVANGRAMRDDPKLPPDYYLEYADEGLRRAIAETNRACLLYKGAKG